MLPDRIGSPTGSEKNNNIVTLQNRKQLKDNNGSSTQRKKLSPKQKCERVQ